MSEGSYFTGFGNHVETEAERGALPVGQNSPQRAPLGLYAEQLSGTPFTNPRSANLRSWLYRIRPAVAHGPFRPYEHEHLRSSPCPDAPPPPPSQLRWDPIPAPGPDVDFIDGLKTVAVNGDASMRTGMAAHLWSASASMTDRFFYDADGDLLLVPWDGEITMHTEFGRLALRPGEIGLIPRGIRFRVELHSAVSRGYICENFGLPFRLPDLGPIGANGLAHPRDFLTPGAAYEDREGEFRLIARFEGRLWQADIDHSPIDVVAWHGNYAPCKYDLARFNTINTVSFDHPDPSIFTVLTSPSEIPGTANVDFVIFPPRWMVAEHTFRPPYFHRNFMNEYMGLIVGSYDAKAEGFFPGGGSLHNCMSGHGPDADTYAAASSVQLEPQYLSDTLAFMFETRFVLKPTRWSLETPALQHDYWKCWSSLTRHFSGGSA